MNWSFNQENIINLIKGDLLVSASAGSGKTAVLVERIINLILNHGVSIDEILIITFTNAAASEMSERILNVIESKINDENKSLLEEQMFLISNANIQTFHAFCLEILKNNYYKLNLSGNLKILKDSQRKILINEVIEEVFLSYYEKNHEEFISLVNKYGGKYSDEKLREFIILIYNFIQTKPNMDEFKEEILNTYKLNDNEEILNTFWGNILKNECIFQILEFKNYALNFIELINREEKVYEVISNDISIVEEFIYKINKGYKECSKFLEEVKFLRFPSKLGDDFEEYKDYRVKLKKVFETFKKDIFFNGEEVVRSNIKELYKVINTLIEVVYEFKNVFDSKKRNQNLIDFNDMEHLTLKLLEDKFVSESFRNKFKYIFIDEYQDTNYIQEHLINKIKRHDEPNVFMVGDIKQSIYSFRGAKVDLFHKKYKLFNKVNSLNECNDRENKILLYDNYRSRKEIIEFINYIFRNVMVKDISDIEYTEEEHLNYMGDYETSKENGESYFGEVKLGVVLKEGKDFKELNENEVIIDEIDEGECNLIVKYIKDLISSNDIEHKIFDKDIKQYRKIEYRDIVILMRNVKASIKSSTLEEVLLKNNIPVYFDGGDTFFDSIEVMVVVSLLKVIDNPLDDIDLLTILRSDIFKFSENDLAYLRIINNEDYLYNNIKFVCDFNVNDNEKFYLNEEFFLNYEEFFDLYNKCKNFLHKVNEYREKSLFMKIDDFIWYLYVDTNYYFNVSIKDDGLNRQNNLKLIFNKAKEFRIASFSGLFNFIEYLKNSKKSGDDILVPKNISKNENVVRIMSIHKSKGLEFPVVILCNTSSSFNMKNLNSPIVLDDEIGIGINYIDYENNLEIDSLIKIAIKNKLKRSIVSEELRILYVALTRAKEKLFITGTYKDERVFKRVYDLYKCKSYLDFICNALMSHKEGNYFRDKSEKQDFKVLENQCEVFIEIFNSMDLISEDKELKVSDINDFKNILNGDSKYLKEVEEILNFNYKFQDVIDTPMNVSVSEILSYEHKNDVNVFFKKPNFLNEDNKKIYTSIDIGNLYHLFMQNMELKSKIDIDYINSEINRMINTQILENEDLNYLNPHKILKFFNTNLGIRLIKCLNDNKNKIYREFEFLMKHKVDKICKNESIRIQGIIDLFFFEDDKLILVDYKTDKMIFKNNKQIPLKYKEQLKYYKLALEKIFKKEVKEKYIYSFEISEEIRI